MAGVDIVDLDRHGAKNAKLHAYKRQTGWTFPWASSLFDVSFTERRQSEGGIEHE